MIFAIPLSTSMTMCWATLTNGMGSGLPSFGISFGSVIAIALVITLFYGIRKQIRVKNLPLILGEELRFGHQDGRTILRCRACLGEGRRGASFSASATVVQSTGKKMKLIPVFSNGKRFIGPFVVLFEHGDEIPADAQILVQLQVDEFGKSWSAERSYPVNELRSGQFQISAPKSASWWRFFGRV